jgi:hypothetical protein
VLVLNKHRDAPTLQFAQSVRTIDWLRVELLNQTANLFKGIHRANQHFVLDSLSSLLISSYVLGRQLGFSFAELDKTVKQKLKEHVYSGHKLEEWYGSLSEMEEYFNKRLDLLNRTE